LERPPETLSLRREGIKLTIYAILFAIPAVWGFVQNVLPYLMTKHFALLAPDEAMRAIWGFFVGIFISSNHDSRQKNSCLKEVLNGIVEVNEHTKTPLF
jgi:hypothetical protein